MAVTVAAFTNEAQSAQLAGLATGSIFFIPLTVKYGRRSTYLVSATVLAVVAWWTASMHTCTELIITNIITGPAGAINETANCRPVFPSFTSEDPLMAFYFTAVMTGSLLTPLAAGTQAATQGWRGSYYYLSIALTILSFLFAFLYKETKYTPAVISQHQTTNFTSPDHKKDILKVKSATESTLKLNYPQVHAASRVSMNTYRKRMRLLSTTPESLTQLFILPLHVITLPHAIGLMTLGPFVGNILGSLYGGPFADWAVMQMRLYLFFLPVISMAGGITTFGITSNRGMHWIFPSIGGALFAFGLGANGDITFTLVIDTYKELTAEAFFGVAFIRNAVSAGVPSALVPWMSSMGLSNIHILSGVVSLLIGLLYAPLNIWRQHHDLAVIRYEKLVGVGMAMMPGPSRPYRQSVGF
ncbi:major facilitator superfamily domain-containing protein [Colletotrichum navitas]|uniref:Major facilitator superfamily domain-containing protein n=1 Tax=Colletotrichum navitas TaxID=681940 RepID=A0AAD8V5C0_9PEZI|nr:major facilitator superfamily domain-containing protein [Colletotrichum navitas]KAK1593449.1 major facilitator superfamily domain-containing protein [Colletotrichum navitas]